MKNLVIVESPTKARTLSQFLGSDYKITASMGHVRDLPRGEFGVDVEHGFEPKYVIPKEKIKMVNILAKEAAAADNLWLASDPDREGEAIAWNLLEVVKEKGKLKNPKYQRVVFHEITKDAVLEAFEHPRQIDADLVDAQQARRILDRLVGYKLSPLLWKKVKSGLSAGRVQSVALRLVVDREREIEGFKPVEYWVISAELQSSKESKSQSFIATLVKIGEEKAAVSNKDQADKVIADLEKSAYKILKVEAKDAKKYPNPPFTTSTLQQIAASRLGYAPKRTMRIAQDLYEEGLITYMRTDSVNLSPKAVEATRKYIADTFGKDYLPANARHYKAKSRLAQEAHEAIRPTNVSATADKLPVSPDHKKLYELIWRRMVVCQMAEAVVAETTVDVEARGPVVGSSHPTSSASTDSNLDQDRSVGLRVLDGTPSAPATPHTYLLRANGQKVKFDGWYKVYEKAPITEQILPSLSDGEDLDLKKVNSEQKFTEPPPRYTEATLIRDLEKHDIGRPSTYAPTISTLYERVYIEKLESKKIGPTPVGETVIDFLEKYFPEIIDLAFTAKMEEDLDKIAQGEEKMAHVMEDFWGPFIQKVEKVLEEAGKMKVEVEETGEACEKCGKPMVIRYGRFGKFMACSGFPDCKNTKTMAAPTGLICPDDGGEIVTKRTKRGKMFWGCANYPKCKYASWTKPSFASISAGAVPEASADTKVLADRSEGKPEEPKA
ncbi:MAG: type I DNA topoisomerase [Candidatus Curtissbacteria bacterium]|nr:type I DNA topoisomerase [Candidatus Curtissbacteria bacterium]